jgi:hypothetical protein
MRTNRLAAASPLAAREDEASTARLVPEFAVPIMPTNDLDATLAFYERLGFENAASATSEWNYLIIKRGTTQLRRPGCRSADDIVQLLSLHRRRWRPLRDVECDRRSD